MKISFSNLQESFRKTFEDVAQRHIAKLEQLLKRYSPDLVQLHGSFEKHPRKIEYSFHLNLTLPTGSLHSTGLGPDVRTSSKRAFAELELQVKKHQGKLRKDYEWKRKRPRSMRAPEETPAAD